MRVRFIHRDPARGVLDADESMVDALAQFGWMPCCLSGWPTERPPASAMPGGHFMDRALNEVLRSDGKAWRRGDGSPIEALQ
jgi:hypothetical protein